MSHHDQDHKHKSEHHHSHDHNHSHTHDHGQQHDHSHDHEHTHTHDHGHDHAGHDHNHDHKHSHDEKQAHSPSSLSFEDQLNILFNHWIKHNDSHVGTYKEWAGKAREKQMQETAVLLDAVADLTEKASRKIEEALRSIG